MQYCLDNRAARQHRPGTSRWMLLLLVALPACVTRNAPPSPAVDTTAMSRIPSGTFVMGTDSSEIASLLARYETDHADLFTGEVPRHTVRVDAFALDRTEVTTARFRGFLIARPEWQRDRLSPASHNGRYLDGWTGTAYAAGMGQRPVTFITLPAAAAYCAWRGTRLPTEVEWEYAARGGLVSAEFPWGDAPPDTTRVNYGASHIGAPVDVGRYPPNGYGLFDMAGNVWEYTADRWDVDSASLSTRARAEGPGTRYVIRGGSYGASPINLRVRYRDSHPSGGAGPHVGFRSAKSQVP